MPALVIVELNRKMTVANRYGNVQINAENYRELQENCNDFGQLQNRPIRR